MSKIPNSKYQIPNRKPVKREFDLEERAVVFSKNTIRLCKKISHSSISRPIISQLIRSSTSVGANYMEANNASSKKDFRNKIYISKKEVQESHYWLDLLRECVDNCQDDIMELLTEAQELAKIFQAIASKIDKEKA